MSLTLVSCVPVLAPSVLVPPPPKLADPVVDPPWHSTFSDTSSARLFPSLLGAIQRMISTAIRELMPVLAPGHTVTPPNVDTPGW
ncbi:UNVERIFIED_CONTAM: hypothetical protein Sradi_2652200 [Sesamum radiatum]|uniref:Secreted protein n=1 Tax=Sesamum radiatum TaxID=300843 RepID=A0AAW2S5H7_SESRA